MCLKNFTTFTGGYLQWRSFFVKLQTWHAGVFLWVLLSFQNSYSKVYLRATASVLFSVTYALVIISDWLLIKSFKSFVFSKFTFLTLRENCPNTDRSVFSCIQSEYRKTLTRKYSVFGHFSCSLKFWKFHYDRCNELWSFCRNFAVQLQGCLLINH